MRLFGGRRVDARRLLRAGTPGEGRIAGIRVRVKHHQNETFTRMVEYAVAVDADPSFTAGVRQDLRPDDIVRLGMPVAVRHDGERAVIDWAATAGGRSGAVQLLDEPPAEGIDDLTLALWEVRESGVPVRVRIEGLRSVEAMRGMLRAVVLDVLLQADGAAPRRLEVPSGEGPPFYAAHLCAVGAELPGWLDPARPDRPYIDWQAAAVADPGVGRPPAPLPGAGGR